MIKENLAHLSEDGRVQILKDHLKNVGLLAGQFGASFQEKQLCQFIGYTHDIGKIRREFQEYIRKPKKLQVRGSVRHASPGMEYIMEETDGNEMQKCVAGFVIDGHHAGLPDYGHQSDLMGGTFCAHRNQMKDYDFSSDFSNMNLLHIKSFPNLVENELLARIEKDLKKCSNMMDFNIILMTYIRMIFSALVDADFLDTETFMNNGISRRGKFIPLKQAQQRLDNYIMKFQNPHSELNKRRTAILNACVQAGDLAKYNLYELTVPTGGGKTISSLAFALHDAVARKRNRKRIIYVIPYTSIIEQTARIFRTIIGDDQVLEHHHNVNWDDEGEYGETKRLASENWDAPLIVTTNVQFFESLFSNRPSKCRKLHNIANSVIVFDEAQMIPLNYLVPCMRMIQELVTYYNCTVVFCTATQPALGQFFPETLKPQPIISNYKENYRCFKRVNIFYKKEPVSKESLVRELSEKNQTLCIVNRKNTASDVFDLLPEEGRFYLTTNLYPAHRKRVLDKIQSCLKAGKICRVVATSLVEAGVDFDFPYVYREMAGLDNIIQAAGRCNRENKRKIADSITEVFTLAEIKNFPQYVRQRMQITQQIIKKYKTNFDSPEAIQAYFRDLHHVASTDAYGIGKILENEKMPFATIAKKVHLIQDNTISIIIPFTNDAEEENELNELIEQLKLGFITQAGRRKLSLYSVAVYPDVYHDLVEAGKIQSIDAQLGVLADRLVYDFKKGLLRNFTEGDGIFF